MKNLYINDLFRLPDIQANIVLFGWISAKRDQGKIIFFDVCDSTGKIQVTANKGKLSAASWITAKSMPVESGVSIFGRIICDKNGVREIDASNIEVIGNVTKIFSPHPRENIDIFDETLIPHMLDNRHMYIRNPRVMAILKFRDALMHHVRQWFYENRFVAIDAPILTPVPLYDDGSALCIKVHDESVFLTQCVGYYLEAAVHAFEKVFNIGPSFRGEESRSKRHLMEYWHIKAEVAWSDLDDIIQMVENIVKYVTEHCYQEMDEVIKILGGSMCLDGLNVPYPRISYEESVNTLRKKGMAIEFGKSFGSDEESELSKCFPGTPFWITGIPRSIEPFPYVIDPSDNRVTRVADLIASNGYGELLGTAEKIYDLAMLDERLKDKGKNGDKRFEFVRDVHQVGCVPHAAFGMGAERMIRWLLNIPHVRDAAAFPRTFKRKITP